MSSRREAALPSTSHPTRFLAEFRSARWHIPDHILLHPSLTRRHLARSLPQHSLPPSLPRSLSHQGHSLPEPLSTLETTKS